MFQFFFFFFLGQNILISIIHKEWISFGDREKVITFFCSSSRNFLRNVFFWSSIILRCSCSSCLSFGGRFFGRDANMVLNSLYFNNYFFYNSINVFFYICRYICMGYKKIEFILSIALLVKLVLTKFSLFSSVLSVFAVSWPFDSFTAIWLSIGAKNKI